MDPNQMTPQDYLNIFKRRKWALILPAVLIMAAALVVAVMLPPVYKSTATILIEEQDIPDDYVKSTVNVFAEQQLQIINQRVMSATRLMEIIEEYGLYAGLRDTWTTEQIVSRMRSEIAVEPISVEVIDKRTGRPTAATIAFTLSYEGRNPDKTQQIANVLTSLFLEENVRVREKQASGISNFINAEMEKVRFDLQAIDDELAEFKGQHINELPELLQVNMQNLNNLERSLDRLQEQLTHLREREGALQTQLASIPRDLGEGAHRRLEELRTELIYQQQRYSQHHPDVIQTKAEIARLEAQIKGEHVESSIENPAYVTVASQLASTRAEIGSLSAQGGEIKKRVDDYQARIEATPRVEAEYKALMVERNNTQAKYDDLMRKLMEARVSQGLEKEQKGERFTLLEPARLPESPYKPNRMAIILIGLVLGVGAGVGLAAMLEFADDSVRGVEDLNSLSDFPVLGTVPMITIQEDFDNALRLRYSVAAGAGAALLVGIVIFHFAVMNLNVFWAKLVMRLGM